MAQKNRTDLTTQANVIKNETVARRNTALRVGTMNVDEIDSFKNFETDKDVNIWYVSTSGNDANVGSEKSRPFKNLMAAHAAASANEVIKILDVGFTSSSALTFTKPLIIIGPANNEHGILGATISSTLSLSTTLTLINVKFTCTVTMSANRTIIVKNSFFNPTSLSTRLTDLEIYDSTHFVKTASQLRTLTAKGVYFEDTNLLSIGRNFELYNCVSDGSITAGVDVSSPCITKNVTITENLNITGDLIKENTTVGGEENVSGTTTEVSQADNKLDKVQAAAQEVTSDVEFLGNVLADKLAASVATILNTGDFGGGVAIGSGVAGISTAPLDGILIEGMAGFGPLAGSGTIAGLIHIIKTAVRSPDPLAADLIIESLANNGMSFLTDNAGISSIFFGDQDGVGSGRIQYSHASDSILITAGGVQVFNLASTNIVLNEQGNDVNFRVESDVNAFALNLNGANGRIGYNVAVPAAQSDINQNVSNANIPVLKLTQTDLSEEMIKLDATIGIGNPIEAIGAKSFTQTHFLKINVEGLGVKYMPIGDLA